MTTTTLSDLDHDLAVRAHDLVAAAVKRSGLTTAELRAVLPSGYGLAVYGGDSSAWPTSSPRERAAAAAGRLLTRLHHELFVPYESVQGASALSIATELLT